MSTKHLVVNHGKNPHLVKALIDHARENGFNKGAAHPSHAENPGYAKYLADGYERLSFEGAWVSAGGADNFTGPSCELVSVEEFFRRTSKPPKPEFYEVVLNSEHTAKVYKDKVVVGCQTFSTSKLNELIDAHNKVLAE